MTTKEHPILFSGDMVRAILDGRKTQMRRPIKCACNQMHLGRLLGAWGLSRPPFQWSGDMEDVNWRHFGRKPKVGDWIEHYQTAVDDYASQVVTCPFGAPGDLLWVRETFCRKMDDGYFVYNAEGNLDPSCCHYKADGYHVRKDDGDGGTEYRKDGTEASPWVSPVRMPRWASRITLEVVSVRAQRVQEITEEDARAEGVEPAERQCESCGWTGRWDDAPFVSEDNAPCPACHSDTDSIDHDEMFRRGFLKSWQSIYGRKSLDAKEWVWAVEFRRVKP